MLIALTLSLALAAVTTAEVPMEHVTRYVAADVLLLRSSPEPSGDVIGRVLINTPLVVVGERAGYAQVTSGSMDFALGYPSYGHQPPVWVSADHLGDAPTTARDARAAFQRAADDGDAELATTWAERVVAIEGRQPRALTLLAQAAGLLGDDARRERLHREMEQGRTLIGACSMTGAYLVGELFDDGRFVSAVHLYEEDAQLDGAVPTDALTQKMRARLQRLAREVASMRFVDVADGRPLPGSPFARARLMGLESSVVADEIELTYGLKVGMGHCPDALQGSLFASRPMKPVQTATAGPRQLTPKRSAGLIKRGADKANNKLHEDIGDVLNSVAVDAVPGDPMDASAHAVRRAVFTRGGHYEPYALTRWALLDGADRVLVELDVPGAGYRRRLPSTWFQAGDRRVVFLNWGGQMQSGVQAVFLDDDGGVEHLVMPSIVASGC